MKKLLFSLLPALFLLSCSEDGGTPDDPVVNTEAGPLIAEIRSAEHFEAFTWNKRHLIDRWEYDADGFAIVADYRYSGGDTIVISTEARNSLYPDYPALYTDTLLLDNGVVRLIRTSQEIFGNKKYIATELWYDYVKRLCLADSYFIYTDYANSRLHSSFLWDGDRIVKSNIENILADRNENNLNVPARSTHGYTWHETDASAPIACPTALQPQYKPLVLMGLFGKQSKGIIASDTVHIYSYPEKFFTHSYDYTFDDGSPSACKETVYTDKLSNPQSETTYLFKWKK
ncbi:MAG: hypothetical protein NC418_10410 [Muribaculaceae bacterium]|nr:hypothetical protein [Muribaculaceae bacterium]